MKKAVIAVAAVLVFIFTLTQKSEAVTAAQWSTLSNYLNDGKDYYSSPIELTANITSDDSFVAWFTLGANKKITSVPGSSFSLSINADHHNIFRLDGRKLMFQNLSLLTFSNATDSAIQNTNFSMTTFDTLTAKFLSNSSSYAEDGGAILNGESTVSFVNSTVSFSNNSARYGGAILNLRSSVSFVNSTVSFLANTAREGGGAILNWNYSTVSFVNSTASFSSNTAREDGGAILNWNYSAVSFVNSRVNFLGNSSKAEGGAILNSDYSAVSFVNSTVSFVSNSVRDFGGAIENRLSILVFDKSTAIFFKNTAKTGGAIYNQGSTVSFVNSTASFLSNTATGNGGAIFNDSKSTIIFKGRSSMIFENNTASKGADIYNNGTIEISERSEVILRSGIDWDPTKDGVINIKSGTLTISADKIFISVLNVSAGGKFSLVDRQAIFATVYKTKTARIDKLTVAGILEIGIDLSTDNLNDIISSADSITFQKGSSLKIAPFNEWSSPKTYSVIFEGDLRGFENLNYDRSRFVLNYDNKTKTLSLRVISDPTQ